MHLTQVKGVLSVRPNLNYLDKSDKRAKVEGRTVDPDDPETESKPEAVTVKFSKGENDRSLKWKEKSYSTMIKREEEEPWIDMKFNQVRSRRWDDESQNLFCEKMEENIDLDLPSNQYLNKFK
ncbi:DNA-directed RNA polymerase III subunit RPC5 [Eurytemora carolleeae]|uniref:DNA-directed RNA polymerase III subunit RPC5 n=1 Tax=Eurytemora carolleeae TaxID=1294199 RepID=UPI000C78BEE7|nr:DNA-directed RNA polymerase III subunit RPC5 [Eurytemora carolleeae]|eukprot:XP_023330513.1 DNA-directed RNA polymerase III subunit RPC5-like [Eurytemora affinis]